jgi:arylformamidase
MAAAETAQARRRLLRRSSMEQSQAAPTNVMARLTALIGQCDVIDLGPELFTNMHKWWSHPDLQIVQDSRNFEQNGYFLQTLILPEHVGCHVDVPIHNHPAMADRTMAYYPPDCVFGPAKKIDVGPLDLQPGQLLTLEQFQAAAATAEVTVDRGDIVVVEFGWDANLPGGAAGRPDDWWGRNAPGFTEELCAYLAERGPKAVGSDTGSVDLAQVDAVTVAQYGHRLYFLPRDILIIEGIQNLAAVPAEFLFVAMPLRIRGGSGSPLRPMALVPRG